MYVYITKMSEVTFTEQHRKWLLRLYEDAGGFCLSFIIWLLEK